MPQPITSAELGDVEAVLAERKTLAQAAVEYTPRTSVLLAVAILYLCGWEASHKKGEYGQLLEQLAQEPGVPEERSAKLWLYEEWPVWYSSKYRTRIVEISRQQNWHTTPVNRGNQHLNPPPELAPFKANSSYCAVAKELLLQATKGCSGNPAPIDPAPGDEPDFALIKRVVQAEPGLVWAIPRLLDAAGSAAEFAVLYRQHTAELRRAFPALLPPTSP